MPHDHPTPEQIRAARIAACLTQKDAAALIKSAAGSWQQWESGLRKMHPLFCEVFQERASGNERKVK